METRSCQNCKISFEITPDDFLFYEKVKVPPPTFCWKCRAMRRMSFRNMRYLYKRNDAQGRELFAPMPPEAPVPVYDHDYWQSDKWDPTDYGREYDFSRPFFEQWKELYSSVPWGSVWNYNSVNCDYSMTIGSKNCYWCFDTGGSEDSAYGITLQKSKQCYDTINCKICELNYFSINNTNCYKNFYSRNNTSCSEVWFCSDCTGCTDCFGCVGLRNKNYCIWNEQYSKEEYKNKIEEFKLHTHEGLEKAKNAALSFWQSVPARFQHGVSASGCTGDYLYNVDQLRNCFFANGAQNCSYSQSIVYAPIRDCMDVTSAGDDIELNYEIAISGYNVRNNVAIFDCITASECQYCANCKNISNCFGCVELNSKQYCIFNKQYSKEEYFPLVEKIKKHMSEMPYTDQKGNIYKYGEFFPADISPFGYNETQAYEYFPISKEETEKLGFHWRNPDKRTYPVTKLASVLPETIGEVTDDITKEIIQCLHNEKGNHPTYCEANCTTAFRITAQELQFYRQMNLPLPRLCFNCRHVERIHWRNNPELYKRECMCEETGHEHKGKCSNAFETTYSPERPERVYCEGCYQKEIL